MGFGALLTAFVHRRFGAKRQFTLALNNMTQGVVMFDLAGHLMVCNARFREMYGLPTNLVSPDGTLLEIVRYRFQTNSLDRDPVQYCTDLLATMAAGKNRKFHY